MNLEAIEKKTSTDVDNIRDGKRKKYAKKYDVIKRNDDNYLRLNKSKTRQENLRHG